MKYFNAGTPLEYVSDVGKTLTNSQAISRSIYQRAVLEGANCGYGARIMKYFTDISKFGAVSKQIVHVLDSIIKFKTRCGVIQPGASSEHLGRYGSKTPAIHKHGIAVLIFGFPANDPTTSVRYTHM